MRYQYGGAPQVFNVRLPSNEMQPFAPIIQQASQPLDTGYNTLRMFEALKMQKIQEERLAKQMEFEKLRFESDLEQRKLANETNQLNRVGLIKNKIFGNVLATDEPELNEILASEGYDETALLSNPTAENTKNAMATIAKVAQTNPRVRDIMKRGAAYKMHLEVLKNPQYKDAAENGGLDDTDLENFLKDPTKTSISTPTIKPDYLEAKTLNIEKNRLLNEKAKGDVEKAKKLAALDAQRDAALAPLQDEMLKETDPVKIEALTKRINQISSIYDSKYNALGIPRTGAAADQTINSQAEAVSRLVGNDPAKWLEVTQQLEAQQAAAKAAAKQKEDDLKYPNDRRLREGNWKGFFENYNDPTEGGMSPAAFKEFTFQINNHRYTDADGTKKGIEVTYPGAPNGSQVGGNTMFVPSEGSSTINGDKIYVNGTVYKKSKDADEIEKLKDQGWVETSPPSATITGIPMGLGSEEVLLSRSGSAVMGIPKGTTTPSQSSTSNIPKPLNLNTQQYDTLLKNSNVEFTSDSAKQNFLTKAPQETRDTVISLGNFYKKPVPITRSVEHDRDPRHFDVRSRDPKSNEKIDLYRAIFPNPKTYEVDPKFKIWLKENGYAMVYESDEFNSDTAWKDIKAGDVKLNKLTEKGTAPHFHFEYKGKPTSKSTWDALTN